MKEATGEANITVITIVLIAIVLAVGTIIVNSVLNRTKESSCCNSMGGVWFNGGCYEESNCFISDTTHKMACKNEPTIDATSCD